MIYSDAVEAVLKPVTVLVTVPDVWTGRYVLCQVRVPPATGVPVFDGLVDAGARLLDVDTFDEDDEDKEVEDEPGEDDELDEDPDGDEPEDNGVYVL